MVDEQRLTERFVAMCRVNTPPHREKALVDMVQPWLEAIGFSCVRDSAGERTGSDTGNLIATLPGNVDGAAPIFFSAHFDTVEPTEGLEVVVEEGVIRSGGSTILGADDKAGIAAILEAMNVLVERELPHGEIQLLLDVCEEIGLLGARFIDRSLVRARMGYVLDTGPPIGAIVFTAPTHDILDVTIKGQPAHAGFEPERGISAVQVAARAIERMKLGRLDEETTANVGVIAGGTATNVIPAEVRIRAEARSRSGAKLDAQVRHMRDTFEEAAAHYGARVDIQVTREYVTYRLDEDAEVIKLAQQAAEDIDLPTSLRAAGGGSDANVFNEMGLPACVIGSAMRKIHTHEEHVVVDELVRSTEWVLAIARAAAR